MKTVGLILGTLSLALLACSTTGDATSAAADAVVLDVRCTVDADCPSSFECENELEHGVETSFCVSHDEDAANAGLCPAGFELEAEHGGTFCKPHGGNDDASTSGGADDTSTSGGADDASTSTGADDASTSTGGDDAGTGGDDSHGGHA